MTNIIGIDPGIHGAIAILTPSDELIVHDFPLLEIQHGRKTKREINRYALDDLLRTVSVSDAVAFVERVSAMPGQGVVSMFGFGVTYGCILQTLACNRIATTLVTPQQWKKTLRVQKGKDAARQRASELLPVYSDLWSRKKDHGRAEAALIAYFGKHHSVGDRDKRRKRK